MYKYVFIGLLAVVVYFIFIKDPYPGAIEFQGYTLSSREDNNNTADKNLDIFSYRDETNHHVMIFAIMNNSEFTPADLSDQYLGRFQFQGFKFQRDGSRHLGKKADEVIYMAEGKNLDGLIIYVEKGESPMPRKPGEGERIFSALENFSF